MIKKIILLTIITSMTLVLSGCWNRREINDLVIAVGIGIDKVDDLYQVSVQVVDPNEIAAKKWRGASPVTLYVSTGITIFDAIREMTSVGARKIYFSHLRMLLIGEETAQSTGISEILDFLFRDHELREDFYIAIARETTANEILKVLTPIEKIPANKMFTSLKTSSEAWSATGTVKLYQLLSELMTKGKEPVITGIRLTGDASKADETKNLEITTTYARLQFSGMAVFRDDKLIGWLDEIESKGYNYLNAKVKRSVGVVSCPSDDGKLSIEITEATSRMQVKSKEDSHYLFINVDVEGVIGELECRIDLTDPKTIQQLEKLAADQLLGIIQSTLNKSYELKSDFIGLGEAIHRSNPKVWNEIKEKWPEAMETYPISIKVNVKLKATGMAKKSYLDKLKE